MNEKPLGFIRIPLSSILHGSKAAGECDTQESEERSPDYSPLLNGPEGVRLTVFVDSIDITTVLNKLGVSKVQLKAANAKGHYPLLRSHATWFFGSRVILTKAQQMNPLLCPFVFLCSADLAEKPLSDGFAYIRVRAASFDGNVSSVSLQRRLKLSPARCAGLDVLDWQPEVAAALDRLSAFPGIVHDLRLSRCATDLAPDLYKEVVAHLKHIYAVWSYITGGVRVLEQSVDAATVRALEGRAPAASGSDLAVVRATFSKYKAFGGVTDPERRSAIMRRTCDMLIMIPSLRSFHATMRHQCLISRLIRACLVDHADGELPSVGYRSLAMELRAFWSPATPYVEVKEGDFRPTLGRASFNLAYKQLVLAAIRHFPYLTQPADHSCVYLFQRRAYILGFRNDRITREALFQRLYLTSQFREGMTGNSEKTVVLESVECRWGRPDAGLLDLIQESAFLPQVTHSEMIADGVTVPFILNDFLQRYEGRVFEVAEAGPRVCIEVGGSASPQVACLPSRAVPTAYNPRMGRSYLAHRLDLCR